MSSMSYNGGDIMTMNGKNCGHCCQKVLWHLTTSGDHGLLEDFSHRWLAVHRPGWAHQQCPDCCPAPPVPAKPVWTEGRSADQVLYLPGHGGQRFVWEMDWPLLHRASHHWVGPEEPEVPHLLSRPYLLPHGGWQHCDQWCLLQINVCDVWVPWGLTWI